MRVFQVVSALDSNPTARRTQLQHKFEQVIALVEDNIYECSSEAWAHIHSPDHLHKGREALMPVSDQICPTFSESVWIIKWRSERETSIMFHRLFLLRVCWLSLAIAFN